MNNDSYTLLICLVKSLSLPHESSRDSQETILPMSSTDSSELSVVPRTRPPDTTVLVFGVCQYMFSLLMTVLHES